MGDRIIRNPVADNRIGRFKISSRIIRDTPQDAMYILKDIIVVKAESLFYENVMEYYGYSNYFEDVSPMCSAPSYSVIIYKNDRGKRMKRWVMDA